MRFAQCRLCLRRACGQCRDRSPRGRDPSIDPQHRGGAALEKIVRREARLSPVCSIQACCEGVVLVAPGHRVDLHDVQGAAAGSADGNPSGGASPPAPHLVGSAAAVPANPSGHAALSGSLCVVRHSDLPWYHTLLPHRQSNRVYCQSQQPPCPSNGRLFVGLTLFVIRRRSPSRSLRSPKVLYVTRRNRVDRKDCVRSTSTSSEFARSDSAHSLSFSQSSALLHQPRCRTLTLPPT